MKRPLCVTFLSFVFSFLMAQQTVNIPYIEKHIEPILQEGLDSMAFPGAQVLVMQHGKVLFHKTYGYHTYEKKKKVQLDDLYDFASITKVTTGLPALMKLHGEGQFDIDAPLKTYFPKFKRSNKKDLTFRALLTHQAGLEPYIVFWQKTLKKDGSFKPKTFASEQSETYPTSVAPHLYLHKNYRKKMLKAIRKSKVTAGQGYKYSGLLFLLLPEIIENITGQSFEKYLYQNIYEPIGANDLTYNPLKKYALERIIPTEVDTLFRKHLVQGTVHDEAAAMLGGVSCNAGLFGTAESLGKLFQLYLDEGRNNEEQIIAKSTIKSFTAYQFSETGNRRGVGFDKPLLQYNAAAAYVAKSVSPESFGHSGFTGTFVWADPQHDLIFIFLSNRVYPSRSHRNLYQLNLRPRMHQVVYDSIGK